MDSLIVCPGCKGKFTPHHGLQKYCTSRCKLWVNNRTPRARAAARFQMILEGLRHEA